MKYRYESAGRVFEVTLERFTDENGTVRQRAIIDGLPYEFEVLDDQGGADGRTGALTVRVDIDPPVGGHRAGSVRSRPVTIHWASAAGQPGDNRGRKWFSQDGCAYVLEKPAASQRRRGESSAENHLRAPMPAQVRTVETAAGEAFEKGQTLLVLEAMKMEIRLQAPRAGRVQRLLCQAGEQVGRDQVLVEFEVEA